MMDLYGVGDHGGGPTRDMLDEGVHWMQPDKVAPKMQFGTAQRYFSSIEKQIAPDSKVWNYRIDRAGIPRIRRAGGGRRSRFPPGRTRCISNITAACITTQAQSQAQSARGAGVDAECGEVCIAGVAGRGCVSGRRADRGLEEDHVQRFPRSGSGFGHRRDLPGCAEGLRRRCAGRRTRSQRRR